MERNNDGIFRHDFMILLWPRFPGKGTMRNRCSWKISVAADFRSGGK
jgi:hypothetical protein